MGKYKRIYLSAASTLLGLFAILSMVGVQITSDGDKNCAGTIEDPCISYLKIYNPTAKSIYIYNYDEITLDFSPEIERYELYVKYYGKWKYTNFTMETRLGNIPKDRKYVFVFPRYSTKEFKLVGYKKNPSDVIKWGMGMPGDYLDPVWDIVKYYKETHDFSYTQEFVLSENGGVCFKPNQNINVSSLSKDSSGNCSRAWVNYRDTGAIVDGTLSTNLVELNFTLDNNVTLNESTWYCLVCDGEGGDYHEYQNCSAPFPENDYFVNWTGGWYDGAISNVCAINMRGIILINLTKLTIPLPTLHLDGVNDSRNYEFSTTANISINYTDGETNTLCVDIDDSIPSHEINYTCQTPPYSFNYSIDILRENQFNGGVIETSVAENETVKITIDNRTRLQGFEFNISGNSSDNLKINLTNETSVVVPGELLKGKEYTSSFISSNILEIIKNLTFLTAESKTIYLNLSSQGRFKERSGFLNFTFRGFSLDTLNEVSIEDNLSNSSSYTGTNVGVTAPDNLYDSFIINDSYHLSRWDNSSWVGDTTVKGINRDEDAIYAGCDEPESSGIDLDTCIFIGRENNGGSVDSTAYLSDLPISQTNRFYTEIGLYVRNNGANTDTIGIYLSDLETDILIDEISVGSQYVATFYQDKYLNITAYKKTDNIWQVDFPWYYHHYNGNSHSHSYDSGTTSKEVSVASLNTTYYLLVKGARTGSSGSLNNLFRMKVLNVSGIAINRTNETYVGFDDTTYFFGNYTSALLNESKENISRALLNVSAYIDSDNHTITNYLSNDNGDTWEIATSGEFHTFLSIGNNLKVRFALNSTSNYSSPRVYYYSVDIIPTELSGLTVVVGDNTSMIINTPINDTTSPIYYNGTDGGINDYLNNNCNKTDLTCLVPIILNSDSGGILQISNMNLTEDLNPINLTHLIDEVEELEEIGITFVFNNSIINLSDLKLDFLGSKNITILAHSEDYSDNITKVIYVKYSDFNISLPQGIDYWEVFPTSNTEENVTPYGQDSSIPIWNVTSQAYELPFHLYVKTNETLNSCLNITFTNDSSKGTTKLNESPQAIKYNVSVGETFGVWNWVDLYNCSNRFELPWFFWNTMCDGCVKTSDWEETNLLVT